MKPRFLFDVNVSRRLAEGLWRKEPSIDILLPEQARLGTAPDVAVLVLAAEAGRIVVTRDLGFTEAVDLLAARGESWPGLMILRPRTPIGAAINDLLVIWAASDADEWRSRIVWLPL